MPELPEVETFRRYIDATSLQKTILDISISNTKILEGIDQGLLEKNLLHKKFERTSRHGKYVFIASNNKHFLVLHFGMTGFLKYFKNEDEKPNHTRLLIEFDNNYKLAYVNQRLFCKVNVIDDKDTYTHDKHLGIDALDISFEEFRNLLKKHDSMIKSLLMNQSIIAGIGNIYADEILFQSGIHPATKVQKISDKKIRNMYDKLRNVLNVSISVQADFEKYPDGFIIPHRKKQGSYPKGNETLKTMKVNNRTTYFCPVHQKKS